MTRIMSGRLRAAAFAVSITMLSTAATPADFRQFDWGASFDEVLSAEKLPLHHDVPEEIAYWNFDLAGVVTGLAFNFEDDKLQSAVYWSRDHTEDPNEDYEHYLAYQRHFDAELGPHVEEMWIWSDGRRHSEEEQTLDAIIAGDAKLVTRWEQARTRAELELVGGNGYMQRLGVTFEPRKKP